MKKLLYILFFILLFISCESPLSTEDSQYEITMRKSVYIEDNINYYTVKLDTNYIQTFVYFDLYTNDNRVNYVNYEWTSTDTVHIYSSGVNYGIIPPTNKSSVISDGDGTAMFGFHRSMVDDTISVYCLFIDSQILKNAYDIQKLNFIVRL